MNGVPLTLDQLEPAQRRRAEALVFARILWVNIGHVDALRVADWVIYGRVGTREAP